MDSEIPNPEKSSQLLTLKKELNSITQDLDSFIEKNSERSLEFMKFEAIERLANFISQYKEMIEVAKKLEEDFLNDPTINNLQTEVKWFQERVEFFEATKMSDTDLLTTYQSEYNSAKAEKKALETQLKEQKLEVNKLKKLIQGQKTSSPVLKSNFLPTLQKDFSFSMPKSEKEKVEYLENTSKQLQKTLKSVKEEIQKHKTQQFQSWQEILPIENFFQDCYRSVYHLIFQRQSQLDDNQLSLAYKMFRDNKMELNEIKHKPQMMSSRMDSHVLREAIYLQNEQRVVRFMKKAKEQPEMSWADFKKLPTETVFILISNKKMMKVLKKSLCSYSNKIFLTSESKTSVDQLEEFCEGYLDKLKVRTNGRGSAI